MKILLVIIALAWISPAAQAEYSREIFDGETVRFANNDDVKLAYRVFNRGVDHSKVLLIMGLGGGGAAWGDNFIRLLSGEGYEVIVIDNRDTGDSTFFADWGQPTLWWQLLKYNLGFSVDAPYSLAQMAVDNLTVLADLGYDSAHIVGVSMGGMIAQILAAQYPKRVKTLTSIMSTTFAAHLPPPSRNAEGNLRDLAVGTAESERDEMMRARGFFPGSMARHLMAVFKTGDRTDEVATISRPTLVIHGSDDALIPPEHGVHTAENIEGAQFVMMEGMGHSLPEKFQPRIVRLISDHIRNTEKGRR